MNLRWPHEKILNGFKLGGRAGQGYGPFRPIHCLKTFSNVLCINVILYPVSIEHLP